MSVVTAGPRKTPATLLTSGGMAINYQGVDNMSKATAGFLVLLLRLLFPARGCHRHVGARCATRREDAQTLMLRQVSVGWPGLLRGEDSALIRPYVLTTEELYARRLHSQPGRELWLAVRGVDAGPRRIRGVEVAA